MAKLTPQEYAEKWARRTSAASTDYAAGVLATQVNPGQEAAKHKASYLQHVAEMADVWAARMAAMDVNEWKRKSVEVGAPRLAQGVQASQTKMAQVAQSLLPAVESAAQKARAMPKDTLEARINRATTFMREMSNYKKGRR